MRRCTHSHILSRTSFLLHTGRTDAVEVLPSLRDSAHPSLRMHPCEACLLLVHTSSFGQGSYAGRDQMLSSHQLFSEWQKSCQHLWHGFLSFGRSGLKRSRNKRGAVMCDPERDVLALSVFCACPHPYALPYALVSSVALSSFLAIRLYSFLGTARFICVSFVMNFTSP